MIRSDYFVPDAVHDPMSLLVLEVFPFLGKTESPSTYVPNGVILGVPSSGLTRTTKQNWIIEPDYSRDPESQTETFYRPNCRHRPNDILCSSHSDHFVDHSEDRIPTTVEITPRTEPEVIMWARRIPRSSDPTLRVGTTIDRHTRILSVDWKD